LRSVRLLVGEFEHVRLDAEHEADVNVRGLGEVMNIVDKRELIDARN